ncbi:hypothetical protein GJ744_009763 [Endocarpon pusillum]|uniref:Uncharacterized protein n=1 Tax=Endocarpon pusillum TaxID=364733 RepID=A0A8H7E8N3_9EURO|nr:hypothetical protein GJ744_009763 [Endocarpon pusillum]
MQRFGGDDRRKVERFLEPFGRFLYGEGDGDGAGGEKGAGIGWGTQGEREVREFGADGLVRVVRDDEEAWEQPMRVWECMLRAQL